MRSTSRAAVLAASFVALGVSAVPVNAFADGSALLGGRQTSGERGIASGNQISAPISLPVNVCGNAAGVAGTAVAGCEGGAKVKGGSGGTGQKTSGKRGVASGNQVDAPISAPVNICGNAVAVAGAAVAGCEGGSKVEGGGSTGAYGGQRTDGSGGVASGNQVNAPISLPVNICGNAVGAVGAAAAGCEGGSKVKNGGRTGTGQRTSGVAGVGAGNQVNAPVSAPIDLCGNAVGNAAAGCEGGASVRNGGHGSGKQVTDGTAGVLAGNQANAPISIPVTACGNAGAVLGAATGYCEGGASVRSGSGAGRTSGTAGVLAGNQANAPLQAPADACGNAAAAAGLATAGCHDGDDGYGTNGLAPGETPSHLHNTLNALGQPITSNPTAPEPPLSLHPQHTYETGTPLPHATDVPAVRTLPAPHTTQAPVMSPHKAGAALPHATDVPAVRSLPAPHTTQAPVMSPHKAGAALPQVGDVPAVKGLPRTGAVSRAAHTGGVDAPTGSVAVPLSMPVGPQERAHEAGAALPQVGDVPTVKGLPRTGVVSRAGRVPRGARPPVTAMGSFRRLGDEAGVPVVGGLPAVKGLPRVDGVSALVVPLSLVGDVPEANGLPRAGGVPRTVRGVPSVTPMAPGARVPGGVTLPVADGGRGGVDAPAAPGGWTPKVVSGQELTPVSPPVERGARAVGGPRAELPVVGGMATARSADVDAPAAAAPGIGELRPVAAPQSLASATRAGTAWAVALAGVLACVTGGLALTRRVVLGRR